jgi:hypothetical protein
MDIHSIIEPFPHVIITDFYDDNELRLIWQELDFLTYAKKLNPPSRTGQPDNMMKQNKGLFLDDIYSDRRFSNILQVNRKLFTLPIMKAYADTHYLNENVFNCNSDHTLISYYESSDYYKAHSDLAVVTAVTYFFREPKMFEGGNISFPQFNTTVEIKNNMTIIFPSILKHEVSAIKMSPEAGKFNGYGRYCMSQFLSIK